MPGSGNTNFSQNDEMLRSRDNSTRFEAVKKASLELNDSFSWKPYASKPVTENTMVALLVYAADTSAPPGNDSFAIIWRRVPTSAKQWIAQGLTNLHFANRERWAMMRRDYGPGFMPAPPPPWELEKLNAVACMQTSARPNPYIAQALNR